MVPNLDIVLKQALAFRDRAGNLSLIELRDEERMRAEAFSRANLDVID